ncbi:hypothetical protein Tco_0646340, partial [Tanacetum coccineum]
PLWKRYQGTSELILDTETEGNESEAEGIGSKSDELEEEGPDSESEEAAYEDQHQQAVLVEDTTADGPLGLGYGAARPHALELAEGHAPCVFEVGQSSRSVPDQQRADETSMPSSLPVSPVSLTVPSLVPSSMTTPAAAIAEEEDKFLEVGAQLELYGSILHEHTELLDALPPTIIKGFGRDITELLDRSGAVRDDIHSQRFRLKSMEQRQERATITFGALWKSVLALKAWALQSDA